MQITHQRTSQVGLRQLSSPPPQPPPDPQEPEQDGVNWAGVSVLCSGVGAVTGLAASGIGYVSPTAGALTGAILGGWMAVSAVEKLMGGKDTSAMGPFALVGGGLGLLGGGYAGAMLAASGGSPGLGLAVGVAAAAATLGAGLLSRDSAE
jgi:hypothetical protein